MANYAEGVLNTAQAKLNKQWNTPEQRRKAPTVFELAIRNQSISIPNAQELRKSPLRPVEINYFNNVAAGSGTAKAYNHTGTYGDSSTLEVTYVTHVETFSLPRKIADNNMREYQELFNNLYEMKWKNLRTRHDTSALAYLNSNRVQLDAATMNSQLASAGLSGKWNDTTYALEIPSSEKSRLIQKIKSAMLSRLLAGEYDVIADLQLAEEFEYLQAQGAGNSANTAFQFGGTYISKTQDVIDADYSLGSTLVLPRGMFAGLYWNEGLNKRGDNRDAGGPVGSFGTVADPYGSGAMADISMYTERADTSANTTGGSTQDVVDQWELTMTVGYVAPPLTTANDSVIMEVSIGN